MSGCSGGCGKSNKQVGLRIGSIATLSKQNSLSLGITLILNKLRLWDTDNEKN